jgi:hypothetical protein
MAAVLGTVALTGMVGCGKGKTANLGAASISVGAAKLTLVDVKSVTVTISGGISTPLTVPLVGSGSQYSALVSDLPVGTNYTFTASAKNASSVEIYHGAATGVAIIKNQTAAVIIDMNQVAPVVSISNEAPVIDSLTASSLLVAQGDTVTIKASGHDPDPGQTALLTSSWATTCGTLSPQVDTTGNDTTDGTSTVTFTAPLADGPCTVNLTVTDPNGVLKNVASLTIQVGAAAAVGSAKMTANLDTYPVISGLNATPVPLVKGAASTLTVTASDSDGDALNYLWTVGPNANGSGTCTGSFGSNTQASTTFTLDNTSTMAECTFLVRVDDGNYPDGTAKGGVITNHLSLPVSGPVAQGGPVFGYDYQSQTTIKGGDVVGFALVANQGCAGANLNVTAVASDGTLIGASSPAALGLDPSVFTVAGTYTAPPNAENLPSVTITATGTCVATGLTATHVFTLVPLNSVCNGMADGTNCTATASAGNACVLSASCLAGVCHVDTSHTCPASGDPCNINTCIPATGSCTLVHDSVGQGIAHQSTRTTRAATTTTSAPRVTSAPLAFVPALPRIARARSPRVLPAPAWWPAAIRQTATAARPTSLTARPATTATAAQVRSRPRGPRQRMGSRLTHASAVPASARLLASAPRATSAPPLPATTTSSPAQSRSAWARAPRSRLILRSTAWASPPMGRSGPRVRSSACLPAHTTSAPAPSHPRAARTSS